MLLPSAAKCPSGLITQTTKPARPISASASSRRPKMNSGGEFRSMSDEFFDDSGFSPMKAVSSKNIEMAENSPPTHHRLVPMGADKTAERQRRVRHNYQVKLKALEAQGWLRDEPGSISE